VVEDNYAQVDCQIILLPPPMRRTSKADMPGERAIVKKRQAAVTVIKLLQRRGRRAKSLALPPTAMSATVAVCEHVPVLLLQ
jgi:hypothetical protein